MDEEGKEKVLGVFFFFFYFKVIHREVKRKRQEVEELEEARTSKLLVLDGIRDASRVMYAY